MSEKSKVSRRRFGRAVLLGGGAGVAGVVATQESAAAAPPTDTWKLGGNSNVSTDGSNYLGIKNVAPLIFKTAQTGNSPQERARIKPTGELVVKGNTAIGTDPVTTVRLVVQTTNASGQAVRGTAPNSLGSAPSALGVQGVGTVGVQGTGEFMGVQASSANYAVFGSTTPDTSGYGVYGRGGVGVKGRSYAGYAVLGDTDSGVGVRGEAYADGGFVMAVQGLCLGSNGNGVVGQASNGTAAYAVWGISTTGYAGFFSGNAAVTGTLTKGAGSFKIDHPLDPENKYLYHSFVESPDMMNVYNGNVRTDAKGKAVVQLPDYFMALNKEYRYQLTVIGSFAQAVVSREVQDGAFEIRTDKPRVKVSWQVTGVRQDAFAQAHRIPVVEEKPTTERGRYLHPAAHGRPASADVMAERLASVGQRAAARAADPVAPR